MCRKQTHLFKNVWKTYCMSHTDTLRDILSHRWMWNTLEHVGETTEMFFFICGDISSGKSPVSDTQVIFLLIHSQRPTHTKLIQIAVIFLIVVASVWCFLPRSFTVWTVPVLGACVCHSVWGGLSFRSCSIPSIWCEGTVMENAPHMETIDLCTWSNSDYYVNSMGWKIGKLACFCRNSADE